MTQHRQQPEGHLTTERPVERAGVVEPAGDCGGPEAPGNLEALDGQPAGFAPDDDRSLRVPALASHFEVDRLEANDAARGARVSRGHVERGHGRESAGGVAEDIRAQLAENRPELEVGRGEARRDHAVQSALRGRADPRFGQGRRRL